MTAPDSRQGYTIQAKVFRRSPQAWGLDPRLPLPEGQVGGIALGHQARTPAGPAALATVSAHGLRRPRPAATWDDGGGYFGGGVG